jgi:hypothetical protein
MVVEAFYGTQVKVALFLGEAFPDEQCLNCRRQETDAHLMLCPDEDRTNVDKLSEWLNTNNRTDPELAYWIPMNILMRGNKPFLTIGYMSHKMKTVVESQDLIRWCNSTKGYISTQFYEIQDFHLTMSSSYLNGLDWTKQFITKVLQITHPQWIYRNISLHDKYHGFLHKRRPEELLKEVE